MKTVLFKTFVVILSAVLCLGVLAGCTVKEETKVEQTEKNTEDNTEISTDVPTEELTEEPTDVPTEELTEEPTDEPTEESTDEPTEEEPTAEVPTEEQNGELDFELDDSTDTYIVTGIGTCTGTNIIIPSEYNGKAVTSIGNNAFNGCSSLTSINIPDSVTSIGDSAFSGCESLTDINYSGTMTQWESIEKGSDWDYSTGSYTVYCNGGAEDDEPANNPTENPDEMPTEPKFSDGLSYEYKEDTDSYTVIGIGSCTDMEIVIPSTYNGKAVTSIGGNAFYGCSSFTSITIPDGVTSIGGYAFYNCSNLTSIRIPDGVTSIGNGALYYCKNLTSIDIPDSVTSIGGSAFYYCISLANVTIGNGEMSIGGSAFYGCSSLTSITIPDSVTSIGDSVFRYCSSLTSVTIGDGVTSIGSYAFNDCSNLESINVAEGNTVYHSAGNCLIETKEKELIFGCKNSVIPTGGSVMSIGKWAFGGSSLTNITIPDSVMSIDGCAFRYCSGLTSITIGNGVTNIVSCAFADCSSLTKINYSGTKEQWANIEKDLNWNDSTGEYTVHCTDGDLAKSES